VSSAAAATATVIVMERISPQDLRTATKFLLPEIIWLAQGIRSAGLVNNDDRPEIAEFLKKARELQACLTAIEDESRALSGAA